MALLLIGIDPGVNTGLATLKLSEDGAREWKVSSGTILESIDVVQTLHLMHRTMIIMEDARLRNWFGQSGPERWQGAGSIKRDCQIWEEVFKTYQMPYRLVPPMHNRTKMSSAEFCFYTLIKRSNQHERDAAALLLLYNYKLALATYEQIKKERR